MEFKGLTIQGGYNKVGEKEDFEVTLYRGDVVCIVGPTGSGKSQLLEDIESLAQGDTPSKRKILLDSKLPSEEMRYEGQEKMVAQLSQNMNFIMDLSVEAFLRLHGESRGLLEIEDMIETIIKEANTLTGEKLKRGTCLTQLSGGQSRALMIADTALMSSSPIVLIDELENAGVNREKAINLLIREDKIILIATHDPILALIGKKRLVIRNGGIVKMITTSKKEKENALLMKKIDERLLNLREKVRQGEELVFDMKTYFVGGLCHEEKA